MTLEKPRDVDEHVIAGFVAERVVDRLEAVDVDEQQGQRQAEPLVTLQLAIAHLFQKPPVVAAGQRIGDGRLHELLLGRFETAIDDAQLVRHVFKHQEMDPERAEGRQHDVQDENLEAVAFRRVDARRKSDGEIRDGDAVQDERHQARANHAALEQHGAVHRPGSGRERR